MTIKKSCFLLIISMAISKISLACSQTQPVAAFIFQNDKNGDMALNLREWKQTEVGHNLMVSFPIREIYEFYRLDVNRDGLIEARELGFDSVQYHEEPCARIKAKLSHLPTR